ncbi:hypothetical protein FHS89_002317 [Rubricella aquisinus]|uniref:Histidine kinase n=1 Tax=Rubricella aquisinus TaxID=2028108 RepID=A0A840WNU2_9RHOB|nr:DUF6446 family protein [Rubricella aquisinus]MBB5516291.1 hypothetical protein [Rubricella aquisinus]
MTRAQIVIVVLVAFALTLGGVLYYTTVYAYYERVSLVSSIEVQGRTIPVASYEGIDSPTSPLKIRGCFRVDPDTFDGMTPATDATPLIPPDWFDCFDAGALTADIASGAATAFVAQDNTPEADLDFRIQTYVAVYPDGRAYLWRQRNEQ